jgi:hypothetical protein
MYVLTGGFLLGLMVWVLFISGSFLVLGGGLVDAFGVLVSGLLESSVLSGPLVDVDDVPTL